MSRFMLPVYDSKFKAKDPSLITSTKDIGFLRDAITEAYAEINKLGKHINAIVAVANNSFISVGIDAEATRKLVENIATKIDSLSESLPTKIDAISDSIPKSYADAVTKNIEKVVARDELKLITQEAIRENEGHSDREKRCIIKNLPPDSATDDIISAICTKAELSTDSITYVPLTKTGNPSSILVTTQSKADTGKLIRASSELQRSGDYGLLSARPDYSPTELAVFRKRWQEAIELNNQASKMMYTVRDLKLVKLKYPRNWIVKSD